MAQTILQLDSQPPYNICVTSQRLLNFQIISRVKILLGHLNAKVERKNIFKLTIRHRSSHYIINDNGIRVVNFAM